MRRVPIEICVEGIDGLVAAHEAGGDRVELCASLLEGGLTPSMGTIRRAKALDLVPFHPIIRPRGGDFLYSELEFQTMLDDVAECREIGVAGVVFGCLTAEGTYDEPRMKALREAAGPLSTTSHRAFDMTRDPEEAIEALVRCGIDRVLTSGQRDTAVEGIDILARTVKAAAGRIKIMVCGALDEHNIAEVLERSGADEAHFASPVTVPSHMGYRNPNVGMGGTAIEREFELTLTDVAAVRRTIAAARAA
jgi:copper homeostasis protein